MISRHTLHDRRSGSDLNTSLIPLYITIGEFRSKLNYPAYYRTLSAIVTAILEPGEKNTGVPFKVNVVKNKGPISSAYR